MPPPPETTWRLTSPDSLAVRRGPDQSEHLVFHELSGDLHLLTAPAVAVLERLAGGPATAAALASAIEGLDQAAAAQVLASLDAIGLVAPAEP